MTRAELNRLVSSALRRCAVLGLSAEETAALVVFEVLSAVRDRLDELIEDGQ